MAGFRSFTVPSTAMDPTIRQGDHIVADMHSYRSRSPRRFETIVFKRADIFYIKRVVAVGGDAVEGRDQVIFINGKKLDEPYVEHIGEAPEWANTFGPVFVPAGKFFVMGDNRDYSLDSRSDGYGLVEQESIVGKPLYVYSSDRTGKSIR